MESILVKKVILFGDSVLFGRGATQRNVGCGRLLRNLLKRIPVAIKGRNADTTREGLQRLAIDILNDIEPSYVIILFGNNDCRLKGIDTPFVSLFEYKENLTKIILRIKSNNKIPILSNLQPIDSEMFYNTLPDMKRFIIHIGTPYEWQKKYSCACNEVAHKENIKLADIRSILESYGREAISKDGLHPNDLGHQLIAKIFLETLEETF